MNLRSGLLIFAAAAVAAGFAATAHAQDSSAPAQTQASDAGTAPKAADPPAPLTTPALTGPITWLPPAMFDAGPLGKIAANGIVTGLGFAQNNHVPGDDTGQGSVSNGMAIIQKADGKYQYFIQAGVYTMPSLGTPFLSAEKTLTNFYGPVPVAFFKLPVGKTTQFLIGSLPTLMGTESTFTFQNPTIERGLLWNQENAVNKGIQVNQTLGKYVTASLSWNDGYYSNRYTWLTGALTFTKGPHTIVFDGMGNYSGTAYQTAATPVQNNSTMYLVGYTYTKGAWIVQPYYQFSNVPTNPTVGVTKGATTNGGAFMASYALKNGLSFPARVEYIASSGSTSNGAVNLLYGPGSAGTSFTVTPTYQKGGLYVRSDVSYVHASSYAAGSAFGKNGTDSDQTRFVVEMGFILGSNVTEK